MEPSVPTLDDKLLSPALIVTDDPLFDELLPDEKMIPPLTSDTLSPVLMSIFPVEREDDPVAKVILFSASFTEVEVATEVLSEANNVNVPSFELEEASIKTTEDPLWVDKRTEGPLLDLLDPTWSTISPGEPFSDPVVSIFIEPEEAF